MPINEKAQHGSAEISRSMLSAAGQPAKEARVACAHRIAHHDMPQYMISVSGAEIYTCMLAQPLDISQKSA